MKTSVLYSILLQLLVVDAQYQTHKPDPCVGLAAKSPVSYNAALACYNNNKLTDEVRDSTIDTLRKALPFYAFIDITKKSPDYNVAYQIDIDAEVRKIQQRKFKSEAEFQVTLTKFFNTLHDGHTRYTSCFSQFTFVQPFPLYTIVGDYGQTIVKVLDEFTNTPALVNAWKAQGIDVNKYAGAEVLRINGKEPLEYIQKYADEYIGTSRDVNSRINYALARVIKSNQVWGLSYGSFKSTTIPPADEKLSFTFRVNNKEQRVEVPYLVTIPTGFNSTTEFYSRFCKTELLQANTSSLNSIDLEKGVQEIPEVKEVKVEAPLPSDNSRLGNPLADPIVSGLYANTYLVNNDTTGVITINTFSAPSATWFNEVFNGFKALKDRKVQKLVLDLSNNGGGVICWGYYVLQYLFPNAKQTFFNTDMHSTPLLREIVKVYESDYFSPIDFNDENGKPFKTNNDWSPIKTYNRGTVRDSKYTPLFQDSCNDNFLKPLFNADGSAPFKKENIAVVTNSVCYSTCTLLSNGLQEFHDIKSFAVGGLKEKKSTVASIAGGTVVSLDNLFFSLSAANLTKHPDAPQPFKSRATLRFTAREAYSSQFKELRPLEFTYLPAKTKINFNKNNVFDPYLIWTEIAKKL